jgi:hypothetical protein
MPPHPKRNRIPELLWLRQAGLRLIFIAFPLEWTLFFP